MTSPRQRPYERPYHSSSSLIARRRRAADAEGEGEEVGGLSSPWPPSRPPPPPKMPPRMPPKSLTRSGREVREGEADAAERLGLLDAGDLEAVRVLETSAAGVALGLELSAEVAEADGVEVEVGAEVDAEVGADVADDVVSVGSFGEAMAEEDDDAEDEAAEDADAEAAADEVPLTRQEEDVAPVADDVGVGVGDVNKFRNTAMRKIIPAADFWLDSS